jgi:pimeloyl-ACP methyl ester carboxylesterase
MAPSVEPDPSGSSSEAFGWNLRDPEPHRYVRLGSAGLWLNETALIMGPSRTSPPFLLVPGAFHGAWCYAGYLDALDQSGVAAAALDWRGHGQLRAEGLSPATGILDYVADTVTALRWLAERRGLAPVIAGHSLGGLVVAAAAAVEPVSGLILLAPSPPGNLPGAAKVPEVPIDQLRAPPSDDEVASRFLGGLAIPDLQAWARRLCPESPAAQNDRYALRIPVAFDRIRGLPGLCIECELDDPVRHPPGQDRAVAEAFGIEHVLLEDAPHCVMAGPSGLISFNLIMGWWRRAGFDAADAAAVV